MMRNVAMVSNTLRSSTTPDDDDFIMALLANFEANKISKDPVVIHKAFYKLKQNRSYEKYFKHFYFNNSGLSPFSDLLDRIFYRLETCALLGALNPRYASYELNQEAKDYFRLESLEKFDDKSRKKIVLMSKELEAMIKTEE